VEHLFPDAKLAEDLIQNVDLDIRPQNFPERINGLLEINGDDLSSGIVF
jgi:hypothetical protein